MWWSKVIPAKAGIQTARRKAWIPAYAGMTLALLLSACGFQLRGDPSVGGLATLHVATDSPSLVATDIRRVLASGPTRVVGKVDEAQVQLRILNEGREKLVATITGTGRVYEHELRLIVRYQLTVPGREMPLIAPTESIARRLITYSETAPVAKEAEEQLLYKDMQVELASRILRHVAVARRDM